MKIERNRVVKFHYTVSTPDGTEIESSHKVGQPQLYLHGHSGIVPGLETAMEGKAAGDQFDVTVPPELAYGHYDAQKNARVSRKKLAKSGNLSVGRWVQVETERGVQVATIKKVGMTVVDLDLNHPLAGKVLVFHIDVVEVREASEQEIQHGHAHGDGGVQH
jgi:FKBP-type peptidyl-prolyl cis-trans isomerase SlyD